MIYDIKRNKPTNCVIFLVVKSTRPVKVAGDFNTNLSKLTVNDFGQMRTLWVVAEVHLKKKICASRAKSHENLSIVRSDARVTRLQKRYDVYSLQILK